LHEWQRSFIYIMASIEFKDNNRGSVNKSVSYQIE
jgi:hypothetical protein